MNISHILRSPIWCGLTLLLGAVLLHPSFRAFVLDLEENPAQRGYTVAQEAGCFACHGPDGTGTVPNPGSEDGEIPGFSEGVPMMWAGSEADLRAYILDGAPARKREDPRFQDQMRKQLFAMPAYRDYLTDSQVDDLVAYIGAVSGLITPPDDLAMEGQELAYEFACFNCHGPMGMGGVRNIASFKGYIPGWWGEDYRELVENDDELRAWILDGMIERLENHFIAKRIFARQRIVMPAYRDFLTDRQVEALMHYLRWVNAGEWQQSAIPLGH